MLVPHDNEQVRSFQVSAKAVRAAISVVLLAVLVLGSLSIGFFVKQGQHIRANSLKRENELLAAEVDQMRTQMETLGQSIEQLAAKDEKYRVIAGLPEVPSDERAAGIGGPGTQTLEAQVL